MTTHGKACAGKCLSEACKELKLKPDDQVEAEMLAVLFRVMSGGGRITIESKDRSTRMYYGPWPMKEHSS